MPSIFDWSTTASSNSSVDGTNIAEACPAANINNAIRSVMAISRSTFATGLQNFLAGTSALPIANGGTGTTATTYCDLAANVTGTLPLANGGVGATTAAGARTTIGAAASGANNDITSLSGLTTALSVAQGGTGNATYTDGQILIGNSTGGGLVKTTLTAGSGISVTNGGGSITIAVNAAPSTAITFTATGTGATSRAGNAKFGDVVSVKDFGAVGDGTTDDTTAINNALAAHKCVYFPKATYKITGTLSITLDGARVYGDGTNGTIITSTSTTLPMFSIASSLSGVTIEDLQLTRSVTATSGADGITSATVSIGQAMLRRLLIQNQYRGLALGPTDFSEVLHVIVQKCQSHGVYLTNTAADGACQWSFDSVLAQMCVGDGYRFQQVAGPAQVTLGTWKNVATFANSGRGISILGSAGVPVNDFRLNGGFVGEDGDDEIYLDTFGGSHTITGTFIELAGRRTTGPTLATAASGLGSGVNITSNNTDVHLTGVHASACSYDGFYVNGTTQSLSGCSGKNNGQASVAGRRNGVNTTSGRTIVTGGIFGNTGAGTSQQYGAFATDGNNLSVGFCDLTNNATAAFSATSSTTYITSVGNLPNTLNVGLSPQGSVLVGGGATGSFGTAGTVNVAGGMLKNNTAYTNP
jgi:hypothetical protein